MKKKTIILIAAVIIIAAGTVISIIAVTKPQQPYPTKVIDSVYAAAHSFGYNLSAAERINPPVRYTDEGGNSIVYNSFYGSDPERIVNGTASFYTEVFDPQEADSIQDVSVNGEKALLCEKDGRSYLIWYPDENMICMLDYNQSSVSDSDILKMAESYK